MSAREPGSAVWLAAASKRPGSSGKVAGHVSARTESAGRVLVVDDEADVAALVARSLTRRGLTVAIAHDAASAHAVVDTFEPDFAVVDICLPDVDGCELARYLLARFPRCRVVAVTGYDAAPVRARGVPFADVLVKPVSVDVLLAALGRRS